MSLDIIISHFIVVVGGKLAVNTRYSCDIDLTVSLVLYSSNIDMVVATLKTLDSSLSSARCRTKVKIVEHSPKSVAIACSELGQYRNFSIEYFSDERNLGFGAGHNKTISNNSDYHLVLNPDVELEPDAIFNALTFMEEYPECGLLSPSACWDDGRVQLLCKNYPNVFDLLLRGFAPDWVKGFFTMRLNRYELTSTQDGVNISWNPPIVSGCFMLFRNEVLRQLNGFDLRFFLYFEDFDISLRAGKITRIAYVPNVKIIHHGGNTSRKGIKHILMFSKSMFTFFNKHGWRWL